MTVATRVGGESRQIYVLHQRFCYTYDAPVRDLNHRLVVVPPRRHGDQRRQRHTITVSAAEARTTHRRDADGNMVTRSRLPLVHDQVEFVLEAVVERVGPGSDALLPAAAVTDPRFLRPTRLTAADPAIRELASSLAGRDKLPTAERFCGYVHEAISYAHGMTTVATTAAEALAIGHGVCQDSAHVMIALCRSAGLPARYVSGHLLGEGGTHAWVEVIVADPAGARAVAFDPCNGRRAGLDYLTVATGRDYTDVAPTSGTYVGSARGTLTATKQVSIEG
ncbi:transglutaminase family protein [Nonomuraea sp. NEAU-A123]|uniref:transglutaminase family protein n=1 Tax=Nonomuraea sp. NEAU-A123 TaxID=2839649 RepID=UPI001BE3F8E5|nr:transglutaminase family protein [Nonomuraea sp. NEAU-A123]MBT2224964.1 transglutaminase family protein [Nonomuraea sp. NEAU-A123]